MSPAAAPQALSAVPAAPSSTCARCAQPFACGVAAPAPCWCTTVAVPADVLRRLAATWQGCLCPACLKALSTPP